MEIISRPAIKVLVDGVAKFMNVTQIKYSEDCSDICIGDYTILSCLNTDIGKLLYQLYKEMKVNPRMHCNYVMDIEGMDGIECTMYDWEGGVLAYDN